MVDQATFPHLPPSASSEGRELLCLNDCHSRLNRTRVARIARPRTKQQLRSLVSEAARIGLPIIPMGGVHAMGGQQFVPEGLVADCRGLNRVLGLDRERGVIECEAGITWPEILAWLEASRPTHGKQAGEHGWAIAQKQTGADRLTLGGALSANIHGRGLKRRPIIDDVESFVVVDCEGRLIECSRRENAELFRLVIGGYGLFGLIYSVRLRLVPRQSLERVVDLADTSGLMARFEERIESGFEFGDFQFQIDHASDDFLRRGIFSCYRAVNEAPAPHCQPPKLQPQDWLELLYLAHVDKGSGFDLYRRHYQRTNGSRHWSDAHQFSVYVDDYHEELDRRLGTACPGSEMITELYVPRSRLVSFLEQAREDLRRLGASVIYGTVRLIERDEESYLAWARESWACVVFNLCVEHSTEGLRRAKAQFRQLIDRALELGGSYYLTYHRFARRDQVEQAHPRLREFLEQKRRWDPEGRFQSAWYRHHEALLA